MILLTVGSQKFQFDRLLKEVDRLIDKKVITEEVFGQIGASRYVPVNYEYRDFIDRQEFKEKLNQADLIITHGGTGAIMTSVEAGKKVIAVPRKAEYGEHVDDHQMELINQFVEKKLICGCMEVDMLEMYIKMIRQNKLEEYQSNTEVYIQEIDRVLIRISKVGK